MARVKENEPELSGDFGTHGQLAFMFWQTVLFTSSEAGHKMLIARQRAKGLDSRKLTFGADLGFSLCKLCPLEQDIFVL